MRIQEYLIQAEKTFAYSGNEEDDVDHCEMGILTELSEIVDICKKKLAYKKNFDLVHLGEEIGDCAWYCVNLIRTFNEEIREAELPEVPTDIDEIELYYLIDDTIKQEGDPHFILFMLRFVAQSQGLDFYELLDKNINKLKVRYPNKFNTNDALNRDLDAERDTLI